MPRDRGHLSQGTGWYLASWSCLCSAVLGHDAIQCLGEDDLMTLGIKSFATEGVGTEGARIFAVNILP